jgi:hypothetical protein
MGRRNRSVRRKPVHVPLCSPQIPHDLTWDRTRAAAVGSRGLTAWAMERSFLDIIHCDVTYVFDDATEVSEPKLISNHTRESKFSLSPSESSYFDLHNCLAEEIHQIHSNQFLGNDVSLFIQVAYSMCYKWCGFALWAIKFQKTNDWKIVKEHDVTNTRYADQCYTCFARSRSNTRKRKIIRPSTRHITQYRLL